MSVGRSGHTIGTPRTKARRTASAVRAAKPKARRRRFRPRYLERRSNTAWSRNQCEAGWMPIFLRADDAWAAHGLRLASAFCMGDAQPLIQIVWSPVP
jgi:hypothetical protein